METNNEQTNFQKCSRCEKIKSTDEFRMKSNKSLSKMCLTCLETKKRIRNRNDPVEITIEKWLRSSKKEDKMYNLYNEEKFVTKEYLKQLIEDCGVDCFYCMREVQYDCAQVDEAKLSKIDQDLGYNIDNITITCHSCNIKHFNPPQLRNMQYTKKH